MTERRDREHDGLTRTEVQVGCFLCGLIVAGVLGPHAAEVIGFLIVGWFCLKGTSRYYQAPSSDSPSHDVSVDRRPTTLANNIGDPPTTKPPRQTKLQALLNRKPGRQSPELLAHLQQVEEEIMRRKGWTREQLNASLDRSLEKLRAMADVLYPHLPATIQEAEAEARDDPPS